MFSSLEPQFPEDEDLTDKKDNIAYHIKAEKIKKKKREEKKKDKKEQLFFLWRVRRRRVGGEGTLAKIWLSWGYPVPPNHDFIGPQLPAKVQLAHIEMGTALFPGEWSALSAYREHGYLAEGRQGLSFEQIHSYEDKGGVMCGSRHRWMEAVRLSKENQIYSAEKKRVDYDFQERLKRENKVLHSLVHDKLEKSS